MHIILIFEVDQQDIEDIERIHRGSPDLTNELIADHATARGDIKAVYPTLTGFDKIEDVINSGMEW